MIRSIVYKLVIVLFYDNLDKVIMHLIDSPHAGSIVDLD